MQYKDKAKINTLSSFSFQINKCRQASNNFMSICKLDEKCAWQSHHQNI